MLYSFLEGKTSREEIARMRICSLENCEKKHYSKGYCKSHYRKLVNDDHKKRWEKIKNNSLLYRIYLNNKKKYDAKYRKIHGVYNKPYSEFTLEQKKRSSEQAMRYKREHPEKAKLWDKQSKDRKMFVGNREVVIQRDKEKCCICGMTRQKHYEKYNRDITVDHKDRLGRGTKKEEKNNDLKNLWTLCISCHMKKDGGLNAIRRK